MCCNGGCYSAKGQFLWLRSLSWAKSLYLCVLGVLITISCRLVSQFATREGERPNFWQSNRGRYDPQHTGILACFHQEDESQILLDAGARCRSRQECDEILVAVVSVSNRAFYSPYHSEPRIPSQIGKAGRSLSRLSPQNPRRCLVNYHENGLRLYFRLFLHLRAPFWDSTRSPTQTASSYLSVCTR